MLRLFCIAIFFAQIGLASPGEGLAYLRHYCKSCHAVGKNRFITSDDDTVVLEYLIHNRAPSGDIWMDAIADTLNWPESRMPGMLERTPNNRRYMPLGRKREDIYTDVIAGENARLFIYDRVTSSSYAH